MLKMHLIPFLGIMHMDYYINIVLYYVIGLHFYMVHIFKNFDFKLCVEVQTGSIQGMGTSGVIYNAIKWSTEKKLFKN